MTRRFILRITSLIACFCMLSMAAFAAPNVAVRAGIHDRFNRIVLDWPTPVKYTMDQTDGVVTIQFDRPATLNLNSFRAAKPPLIQDLMYDNNERGATLSFRIPQQARVQAFWSGHSVAFDVLLMNKDKPAFDPKDNKQKDQSAHPPHVETKPEKPKSDETTGPQKPETLPPSADAPEATPVTDETTTSALRTLADEQDSTDTKPSEPAKVEAAQTVIHVRPLTKLGLAVFARAGRLWIVMDQTPQGVSPQIEGALKDAMRAYTRQTAAAATAFVFDLPPNVSPDDITVSQDELNWNVYLHPSERTANMAPAAASEFDLSLDDKQSLSLATGQAALVFPFNDEAVGDKIWVIPVRSPLLKVAKVQHTAALDLNPTIVGGLLIPQQENLNIIAKDNQITIKTLDDALLLSSGQDRESAEDQNPQQSMLFTLKPTTSFPPQITDFEQQRRYIERAIADQSDKTDKAIQALDLARLYLQQGYGPEAVGALNLAEDYVPNFSDTPSFAALKGMSYALAAHTDLALDVFSQPSLQQSNLNTLWQAYAYAQDKNWEKAFLGFQTQQAYIKSYAPNLIVRLALAAAESAIETGNTKDAQKFLAMIPPKTSLNSGQQAAKDFLQASVWAKGTDLQQDQALTSLMTLSMGTDRYYRVKANLLLLNLKLAKGDIKTKEAIDDLEKLRFAWRGDRQEIAILQQLGQTYLLDKNPLDGMTMWKQALALAQNDTDKAGLQKNLQDTFNTLFVQGDNKSMTPLQALSLYQRFKDLMPTGDDGAHAAMQLADQLLQVDLVDEADDILQEQLSKQNGSDQAVTLGTKLATIRLIARNPEGALKALDDSEKGALSEDVAARRVLLRARALADVQKTNDALALLDKPSIPEGLSLRADVFWRLNRWADAARDLQTLAENTTPKTSQNKIYTGLIMRLAIAKALQNDQAGLDQINAQYGAIMAASSQGKAFSVMTASSDDTGGLSDLATVKSQMAGTELFEGFLKGF